MQFVGHGRLRERFTASIAEFLRHEVLQGKDANNLFGFYLPPVNSFATATGFYIFKENRRHFKACTFCMFQIWNATRISVLALT